MLPTSIGEVVGLSPNSPNTHQDHLISSEAHKDYDAVLYSGCDTAKNTSHMSAPPLCVIWVLHTPI